MNYVSLLRKTEQQNLDLDKERQLQCYNRRMAKNEEITSFRNVKECQKHVLILISKLKRH